MNAKMTVVFHSADYDGVFCREIARKFLPKAKLIGWDFADAPLLIPEGIVYVLDLPVDRTFGLENTIDTVSFAHALRDRLVWIDHHASSIASHPPQIPGYRIDGVSACRLAWQWFQQQCHEFPLNAGKDNCQLPVKEQFVKRSVREPLSVRLAGEYDVWNHSSGNDIAFQFGLDSQENIEWPVLLSTDQIGRSYASDIILEGQAAMQCYKKRDGDIMRERSFIASFDGLKFLALNTARCNSNTFAARDLPDTGHDALMGFFWNGKAWSVSLYHAAHRTDLNLSLIASKYGGGGHRGACGFRCDRLPFYLNDNAA